MTDRDANERLLRLNAALDGELDAMGSLEFEREMRDDPALAAEYRRLAALRDAVRRHAPREAAPQALADRIAALTASAPAAPPPQATAAPSATVVPFPAPRVARQPRAGDGGLLRCPRLCGRRRAYVAAHACGLWRCRATSRVGFRPRGDRRPAVRRRLLRPAYGQALARRPHNGQRNHRRSRAGGLPAGGRPRDHRRPGSRRRRSSTGTTSTSSR